VRVTAQHALDRGWGVEARGYGAAEGFDAGDCVFRGARDDDLDRRGEVFGVLERMELVDMEALKTMKAYPCQQLDAVPLDAVQTA
jgi:hypothetical protein